MCEHKRVKAVTDVIRTPLKGDHWTTFKLLQCKDCGMFTGFPSENLELAVNEGTEETLRGLIKHMVGGKAASKININEVSKVLEWDLGTRLQNDQGPWRYARAGEKLKKQTMVETTLAGRILNNGEIPAGKPMAELVYGDVRAKRKMDRQGRGVLGWPEVNVPKGYYFWLHEVPPGAEFFKEG